MLAARAIAAIENPADVCVISARPYGQRAVLKFASYVGATPIAGRFTPGTFTNQIQVIFVHDSFSYSTIYEYNTNTPVLCCPSVAGIAVKCDFGVRIAGHTLILVTPQVLKLPYSGTYYKHQIFNLTHMKSISK